MTAAPRISIAMATYNGERFIGEQLESLARQTRLPDELVVTDDGSTDATLDIIEKFARSATFPIRLHRNPENLGFARNFEKAMSLCSGDFVFLCDQDDVWFREKLEKVAHQFEVHPQIQVVINDALLANEQLETFGQTQRKSIAKRANADRNFYQGCCSVHRRSWQKFALPLPPGLTHDHWVNGLAIELGCALQMNEVLQLYRRHESAWSEWVLSDPRGVSAVKGISVALGDGRPGWRLQLQFLAEVLARLRERRDVAIAKGLDAAIPGIDRNIDALQCRIRICSTPRHRRVFKVVQLWLRGGYRSASGWKSAAVDLVRP